MEQLTRAEAGKTAMLPGDCSNPSAWAMHTWRRVQCCTILGLQNKWASHAAVLTCRCLIGAPKHRNKDGQKNSCKAQQVVHICARHNASSAICTSIGPCTCCDLHISTYTILYSGMLPNSWTLEVPNAHSERAITVKVTQHGRRVFVDSELLMAQVYEWLSRSKMNFWSTRRRCQPLQTCPVLPR